MSRRAHWLGLIAALLLLAPHAWAEAPSIPLWTGEAPFTDESPDQPQPALAEYAAEGADIAVIVCPGGGYTKHSSLEGAPVAERFQQGGVSAYVLSYRLTPCNRMAPLTDAQRAVRVLRDMGYRYVGILGFSAGGHLACNAATHWDTGNADADDPVDRLSCRPDFFVACYSVVSYLNYPQFHSIKLLLGDLAEDEETLRFFSPEENVTEQTPPAYIWHSVTDTLVPVGNALMLGQALADAGVPYEMHIYPTGKHGIGLAKKYPAIKEWPKECLAFIKRVCAED